MFQIISYKLKKIKTISSESFIQNAIFFAVEATKNVQKNVKGIVFCLCNMYIQMYTYKAILFIKIIKTQKISF